MGRTLLGEDQVIDEEFLSEDEFNERIPHSIHDSTFHTDILTVPTDGQTIIWNDSSNGYIHANVSGGHQRGHAILSKLDHTNVDGTAEFYNLLFYDIDEKWKPISFGELLVNFLLLSVSGELLTTTTGEIITVT